MTADNDDNEEIIIMSVGERCIFFIDLKFLPTRVEELVSKKIKYIKKKKNYKISFKLDNLIKI